MKGMAVMNPDFLKLKMPNFSELESIINPKLPYIPKVENLRIPNAIENMNSLNRLRDMDNLMYQIKMKEVQKSTLEKRLNSIETSFSIKAGIAISIAIILFSVIIPFIIVAFQNYLEKFKLIIFIYLICTFILSMISMSLYLLHFFKKEK